MPFFSPGVGFGFNECGLDYFHKYKYTYSSSTSWMKQEYWSKLVMDHWNKEDWLKTSKANKANRAKFKSGLHCTEVLIDDRARDAVVWHTFASIIWKHRRKQDMIWKSTRQRWLRPMEIHHDRCEQDSTYPSLIDLFKEKHSKKRKNGQISDVALSNVALQAYERMKKLRDDQQGVENPMTEEEIMDEVLGKRRGFKRGCGLIVPGYTCSSSSPMPGPSTPPGRVYTQADVDALLKAALKETKETKRTASIIMAKAMADNGFDVEWEEVEEEEEEGGHDLNSD